MAAPQFDGSTANQAEAEGDYLSVAQVARRLACSVSLVQKWRRLGWLPATRLGPPDVPVYGYHPEDVERFARERWNRRRGRPPGTSRPRAARQPAATAREALRPAPMPPTPVAELPPARTPATQSAPPLSGRALLLWDGDPHSGTALVLGRFSPSDWGAVLGLAAAWARRYDTLVLGEAPDPGGTPRILAQWRNGERILPGHEQR